MALPLFRVLPAGSIEDVARLTRWVEEGASARGGGHDPWRDHLQNDVGPNSPTLALPSSSSRRPRPDHILQRDAAIPTHTSSCCRLRAYQHHHDEGTRGAANAYEQAANTTPPPSLSSDPTDASPDDPEPEVPPCCLCARLARPRCLLPGRRIMDFISDGVQYARDTYAAAVDLLSTVYNAVTSKTAQRTVLTTLLFAILSAVLFGLACVGYLAFYHEYLPDQVTVVPVHLQYGYERNPYGLADLTSRNLKDYQEYDISVTLNVPNSPSNLARGNFMLALFLLEPIDAPRRAETMAYAGSAPPPSANHEPRGVLGGRNILFVSSRPAIIPYTDPLVSLARRVLLLAYHLFVPASEATRLTVPMVERLEFVPGRMEPNDVVLDVRGGQELQVYDVSVTFTARLGGLRWFMHTWWVTSFVLFTAMFWVSEVFFLAATAVAAKVLWGVVFGSGGAPPKSIKEEEERGEGGNPRVKQERQNQGKTLEDIPMTFPTSSQQPPLRYEPEPASHGDEGPAAALQQPPQADADVEDEGGHQYREEEEEEDPQGRDSGIGTSFSERDGGGPGSLRRRTSLRRV